VLAVALLAPPPRSVFEPTAPLADQPTDPFETLAPAPTARPTAPAPARPGAPTATTGPVTYRVVNTGGDGVFLRRTPALADRLVAWPDGTRLVSLEESARGDGLDWQKVRDPRGNVGYVPSRYLARE
jgi:hypothetical protein